MPVSGLIRDGSGTITTGGTSQEVLPAQTGRKFLLIQNPTTASEALWLNFTDAAAVDAAGSVSLAPGGAMSFEGDFVPQNSVNVTATTTGHKFTVKVA